MPISSFAILLFFFVHFFTRSHACIMCTPVAAICLVGGVVITLAAACIAIPILVIGFTQLALMLLGTAASMVLERMCVHVPLEDVVVTRWISIEDVEEDIAFCERYICETRRYLLTHPKARLGVGLQLIFRRTQRQLFEAQFWRRHRFGLMLYQDPHEARNVKAYMAWFAKHVNPILFHPSHPFVGTDAAFIIAQYAYERPPVFSWKACIIFRAQSFITRTCRWLAQF